MTMTIAPTAACKIPSADHIGRCLLSYAGMFGTRYAFCVLHYRTLGDRLRHTIAGCRKKKVERGSDIIECLCAKGAHRVRELGALWHLPPMCVRHTLVTS